MSFARGIAVLEFGLPRPSPWEAMLCVLTRRERREDARDQKLGFNDQRGGRRPVTQKTKRQARLEEARRWLEGKR